MPFFCYNKKDYCANPEDCDNCDVFVLGKGGKVVPSNADRIREMSDEELANALFQECIAAEPCDGCFAYKDNGECPGSSVSAWLEWLQQPVED